MQPDVEHPELATVWAAVGNIKNPCMIGPDGGQPHPGTKHFRAGAKVHVIDAHWGALQSVTVIGQHRKGRRFICIDMPAKHIEDLRAKLVYSPAVVRLAKAHYGTSRPLPDQAVATQLCGITGWAT